MKYKFTNNCIELLNNSAQMNEHMIFFKGNQLRHASKSADVVLIAELSQNIPFEHGIGNISVFNRIINNFGGDECELEFHETYTRLHNDEYNSHIDYKHSSNVEWIFDPNVIEHLCKFNVDSDILSVYTNGDLTDDDWDIELTIHAGELEQIKNTAKMLNLDSMYISPIEREGGYDIEINVTNKDNPDSCSSYTQRIDKDENEFVITEKAKNCKIHFNMEQLRYVMNDNYTIKAVIGRKNPSKIISAWYRMTDNVKAYYIIMGKK